MSNTSLKKARSAWAVIAMSLVTALALAACGGGSSPAPAEETSAAESEPTQASEPADTGAAAETQPASDSSASGEPITIGYVIAKTGGFQPYDVGLQNGAKIAIEEINAAGGVLGRPFEIIDFDTKSDLNQSAPGARDLIAKGAEFIIATSDYDFGGPAIREANTAGIVGIAFAGDPLLGFHGIGPLAFNSYQTSSSEGAVMAEFAADRGWTKAFVLTDTINSYPETVSNSFKTVFTGLGGSIVGEDTFANGDPSIASQITRIKGTDADVIVLTSFPPGGSSAIKQIRASGIATPIVVDEAFDGSYWEKDIPGLSDVFIPHLASPDGNDPDEAVNAFFEKYAEVVGEPAQLGAYPAMGYTQIQTLAQAIEDAGSTDGQAVATALANLTGLDTLLGTTTYSWRGECNIPSPTERPFKWFQVQDGAEEFIATATPESAPDFDC